jgi:hypothetical protein
MKKKTVNSVLIVLTVLLLPFVSKSQDFEKVRDENLKSQIQIAKKFSEDLLNTFNKNQTYTFKDEATDLMKTTFTPEYQKLVNGQLKKELGDYKSSTYVETWVQKSNPNYKIYRFKGDFSNSNKKVEIRTILDGNNKIAGIFVKPWSDVLQ